MNEHVNMTLNSCNRREFMKNLAAGSAALALSQCYVPQKRLPNIIYILADDLGYGDLGCYGQTRFWTPHLDRLAAEGMKLSQPYARSTVCALAFIASHRPAYRPYPGSRE